MTYKTLPTDEWETPQDLFNKLKKEFPFTLDAAATHTNTKCDKWLSLLDNDALTTNWKSTSNYVWLNPPYSKGNIELFMRKAYLESISKGCTVVCLVRMDPSTKWWQNFVHNKAAQVRMISRRIKFVGAKDNYPFPSAIVVYTTDPKYIILDEENSRLTEYLLWNWK